MLPSQLQGKRILYTVLNWGLGHAARSVPLIRQLLTQDNIVHIASDGLALGLLQSEFPSQDIIELAEMKIHYEHSSMVFNMLTQLPHLSKHYYADRKSTKTIVGKLQPDVIISDNRYGTYHNKCHNIFLGHQLSILNSNLSVHKTASFTNATLINAFDEVWVPDFPDRRLSGILSSNKLIRRPIQYINPLSRFINAANNSGDSRYELIAVLSGPEPSRTRFEATIINILNQTKGQFAIVRGIKEPAKHIMSHIDFFTILETDELQQLFDSTDALIARAGYSTLMDVCTLGVKSMLIPTNGQTEQMYLSQHLKMDNISFCDESELEINKL